jgi:pimeloyl-ACP methyl ester carboxylesterase
MALIEHIRSAWRIAGRKVTIAGYSAGGFGAWYLLLRQPEHFCAAILLETLPVMETARQREENWALVDQLLTEDLGDWAKKLPDIPLYIIHSRQDELFPIDTAETTIRSLVAAGKAVAYHPVDGIGHFDTGGYVAPLRSAIPWIKKIWAEA